MTARIQTFTDVACTVCGCVCDDLTLRVVDGRIEKADRARHLAEPWFFAINDAHPPVARIDGAAASLDEGLARATEILQASRNPLVYGLTHSSTPGQRAAIRLAKALGGSIDPALSLGRAVLLALQEAGQSTCTLGEVRNRADLVIFWRADPLATHPRHLERYSADPVGEFLPDGRRDRTLVVLDANPTATSQAADLFLPLAAGSDFETIAVLRRLIRNEPADRAIDAGSPRLRDLAQRMAACRYGALFFGPGLADPATEHLALAHLFRMVAQLNAHTRFTASALPGGGGTGASNVLAWQTGFPCAVNFARDSPRYGPDEFSAEALLSRGEADACVVIGSESLSQLSPAAQAALSDVPTIAIDPLNERPPFEATVQFATAVYGVHAAGTAYRMDGVPLPLRQLLACEYPTDESILSRLADAVASRGTAHLASRGRGTDRQVGPAGSSRWNAGGNPPTDVGGSPGRVAGGRR